jgi:deoxyribonuclease V
MYMNSEYLPRYQSEYPSEFSLSVTPKEAIELQKQLRDRVTLAPLQGQPKLVAGCDVSMNRFAKEGFAGFVVLTYPELVPVAHAVVKEEIPFPYIPGLLSFREIPMLLSAWEKLIQTLEQLQLGKPDVLMVDGIDIAHPRRFGIASHLGVLLDLPTIGCAKSVLTGTYDDPPNVFGAYIYLHDSKHHAEVIGAALRTKVNVQPVFISPGHKITLEESISLVRDSVRKHRLPEETRQAHNIVNDYRMRDGAAP